MEYPADVRQPTMLGHAPSPRQAVVRAADLAQYISVDQIPFQVAWHGPINQLGRTLADHNF